MPATSSFEVGRGGLNLAAATAVREGGHYAGAYAGMRTGPREGGEYAKAIPAGTPTAQDDVGDRSRLRRTAPRPWPLRRQAGVWLNRRERRWIERKPIHRRRTSGYSTP